MAVLKEGIHRIPCNIPAQHKTPLTVNWNKEHKEVNTM
jgi:hypothetical protein